MPSSTSSSEGRGWRTAWLVASILVGLLIGSWEVLWRVAGFSPAINDDPALWSLARRRAARSGPGAVVLVGSSRIQAGIDAEAFAQTTGWRRPVQLAIAMGPSLPILRDLARDPSIAGTIVCEVNPVLTFDSTRQLDFIPDRHVEVYADFGPADFVEGHARLLTQSALVSSLPALYPRQLLRALFERRWPRPGHVAIDAERYTRLRYRSAEEAALQVRANQIQWSAWRGRPARPDEITRLSELVDGWVLDIRRRGGDVVFVRMPTTGVVRARERRLFPRPTHWDAFAAQTDAVTIHFEDHPELRRFHPPDGSHLDQRERIDFSTALGRIMLRELGRRDRS